MINSVEEALQEPQIQARSMIVNIPHQQNQAFKMIASPIKLSDTVVEYRNAPPQLGEHTFTILERYCSKDELKRLAVEGIIEGEECKNTENQLF